MEKYIPTFTDISDWMINIHLNTGGSRSKKIAINPESEVEYFFKGSKELEGGEIRYPTEFWSEIVSSKVGQYLGFNMLDYNIGYNKNDKQKIGCLSKSMIEYSENKLTEGKSYLTGYNPGYNPVTDKTDYTFQFISKALKSFRLEKYLPELVEVIIFDALISNSDRHQENWGFITYFKETIEILDESLKQYNKSTWTRMLIKILRFSIKNYNVPENRYKKPLLKLQSEIAKNVFSPIYDSGCCLGREKEDNAVHHLLDKSERLESYINKGCSEIHWENSSKKIKHFDLIKLVRREYPKRVEAVIKRINGQFNKEAITEIVQNIDNSLPTNLLKYKLTDERKELMIKLITLRIQKVLEL